MEYKINPELGWDTFAVPNAVADGMLKLADASQLRLLLCFLRERTLPFSEICSRLGMDESDAQDKMQFWVERGIVSGTGSFEKPPTAPAADDAADPTPAKSEKGGEAFVVKTVRPTSMQVLKRASESPEIQLLFNEAQNKLGRTIGYDGQSALLMMFDSYGLPVEVILMLLDYCVNVNKTAMSYISAVARDWGEREIDTIERADEEIERLGTCNFLWSELCARTGIRNPRPTTAQSAFLLTWTRELGFDIDMICLAYEEMANHSDRLSMPYINKVLHTWHDAGVKTPQDAAERQRAFEEEKEKNRSGKAREEKRDASYDLDAFSRRSLDPVLGNKKEEQ